jgi:hypothetical protein
MKKKKYIDVILTSGKESFSGKFWRWFLGSFSTSAFVFLVGKTALGLTLANSVVLGFRFLLFLFIWRFALRLSTNTRTYLKEKWRESIYGNSIVLLKDLFAIVHSLRKTDFNAEDFMKVMVDSCEKTKQIFDLHEKGKYSVSIKVGKTSSIDPSASVVNLCRNSDSQIRDTDKYRQTDHTIIGNTAFQVVVNSILRQKEVGHKTYYLNNNIDLSQDYQNTSKDANPNRQLSYKSEIVVPIIPLTRKIPTNYGLLGFICVDSDVKNGFSDELYSSAILEGIADGLYDIIEKYQQIKNN